MPGDQIRKFIIWFQAVLLCLPLASGCSKRENAQRSRPPAPVVTATAVMADIPRTAQAVGTVEASETVTIRPQISGELAAVYVVEGQDVVKGQRLFLIDPRPWQAALKKAEASLNRNRVILENARRDHERYAGLVKDGIVTQEQADAYRTKAESAAADLEADRAVVENARLQLAYCSIAAPISGRLGSLMVHRGNVLKANETALLTINTVSPVNVSFSLPERELAELKTRLAQGRLTVEAKAGEGQPDKGVVAFLDNTVDTATGAIRLKAAFSNTQRKLWPGQFVQVAVKLAEGKGVVAVPAQAIQTGQQGTFVFVVKQDMTAEVRPVVVGASHQGLSAIERGLAVGEQVVVDGHLRVVPGGKIEIKQPGEKKPVQ